MPSRFNSPDFTSFRKEPSMELMLRDGHSSRISCLLNLPILFCIAFLTMSIAGNLVSTMVNLSSKSLYAATLLLYRNGFYVGKYISLESKIAQAKDLYYDALSRSQDGYVRRKPER